MDLNNILNTVHEKELDSLLILKPENIFYLSGHKPSSFSILLIKDDVTLYTSKMDMEEALNNSNIPVNEFKSFDEFKKDLNGRVGIEKSMPISIYKKFCDDQEMQITDIIESFRMIKSPDEIRNIQKAIEIAEDSLLNIDYHGTENKFAADLEYNMKFNGSTKPAFDTIVASGKRSSIPHATISSNTLESPIVVDWGAVYNNYCSDITRTFIESEQESEIFDIVQAAQKEAIKVIKPGIKASYVDKVARKVIEEYGYGDDFIHSTGHGFGLEIHENPTISKNSDFKLEKGMIITVEPGIYIKDKFGIRIEDDVLIKKRGKVLTKINKSIN